MNTTLLHVVSTYGYAGVALLVMLEGLGVPVPGETALITAAAFAAQGSLSIVGVMVAASLGTILGGTGGYWIGCAGGVPLIRRYGRWLRVPSERLDTVHGYFERYGAKTVFIGRFVALLRIVVALLAGVARMPFAAFTTYNALGGVCWSLVFGSVGFLFGRNLPRLERGLGRAGFVLALLVALIVIVVLLWRWIADHRKELWQRARSLRRRMRITPVIARIEEQRAHVRGYLVHRFTRGEYLVFHLATGFLASLATLAIFAGITEGAFEHGTLAHFDMALAVTLHEAATPAGVAMARTLSLLATAPVMSLLGIAVAVALAMRRRHLLLAAWAAAILGSTLLAGALEMLVHRPRPVFATPLASPASWSFPSGHALGALVAYGMLAYLIGRAMPGPRTHSLLRVGALSLIVAIAASRLYLGIHYFSDLTTGYAAAAVWLATVVSGVEVAGRGRRGVSQ